MQFSIADLETGGAGKDREAVARVAWCDLLFIDGGDKFKEAGLYAQGVRVGGGILMHDWYQHVYGAQAGSPRVQGLEAIGFEPLYEDVAVRLHSVLRFWRRARPAPSAGTFGSETVTQIVTAKGRKELW